MNFSIVIAWAAAVLAAGIAAMAIWRDPRSFVHRTFALGMLLLAVDAGLTGLIYQSTTIEQFMSRQWLRIYVASILPAAWLLFSITFARANYSEQIYKWKWILLLSSFLPVLLVTFFSSSFFVSSTVIGNTTTMPFIRIGWSGYIWHLLWIIVSIMILMNLERTFRHATGHMRWQTKFLFLGIGGIFGAHLFTDSQVILFKGENYGLNILDMGALLLAGIFILRSIFRGKSLNVSIHLSHQFLYNSFTVLIVGIFFVSLGVVAWFSLHFNWIRNIHVAIFVMLVAVMGVAAVLLSDRLRIMRKRFISRHFKRPQYDYQKLWEDFTWRTTSVTQTRDLCNVIVRMVSETLEILSVSIWLVDEKQESLSFGGSTVFTETDTEKFELTGQRGGYMIRAMSDKTMPVDLQDCNDDWVEDLLRCACNIEDTKESRIRYCVPLRAAGNLIGIMTLSEKVFYESISFEETELIKTIADQTAAGLFNLRLSEKLRQTKELEAFQTMSAFFMHDLKNLASKLSLVMQNLPVHMDNPEFREDAMRTIAQSVTKINLMSNRLSLLSHKLDLAFREIDLNGLVEATISEIKGLVRTPIIQNLETLPPMSIDREHIHKVIDNLLINANDASGQGGEINVATSYRDKWVEIAVRDNGCGMSKEFVEKKLFRPFQTTKKNGMGIGLYHCKAIVEAHSGRIEVESEEGKGSIFRVLLPVNIK